MNPNKNINAPTAMPAAGGPQPQAPSMQGMARQIMLGRGGGGGMLGSAAPTPPMQSAIGGGMHDAGAALARMGGVNVPQTSTMPSEGQGAGQEALMRQLGAMTPEQFQAVVSGLKARQGG